MLLRSRVAQVLLSVAMLLGATPAFADVTAFIGANTSPANRQVRGASLGFSILIIGVEFEYTDTTDDPTALAPSLKVGSGNLLLQPPTAIFGVVPYVTAGGGIYSETQGVRNDKGFAENIGGGVKISLVGPLRVRVDYRVFKLASSALVSPAHRIYVGLNLAF